MLGIRSAIKSLIKRLTFKGSKHFWENNYSSGGNSGEGSYGILAEFKANFINELISSQRITSIIEFGCGDGNQISLGKYPEYIGIDVSASAIELCKKRFAGDLSKRFFTLDEYVESKSDCSLSLDVIYHLVEDAVFESYMSSLFSAARKFVVIYSTDYDLSYGPGVHVRHRDFKSWIARNAEEWTLRQHVPNTHKQTVANDDRSKSSSADFFIYEKV